MAWTELNKAAVMATFRLASSAQVDFVEKSESWRTMLGPQDEENAQAIEHFLKAEGHAVGAWAAVGEALKASQSLSRDQLIAAGHGFGLALMAVLRMIESSAPLPQE